MKISKSEIWNSRNVEKIKDVNKIIDEVSDSARKLTNPPKNHMEVKETIIRRSVKSVSEILGKLQVLKRGKAPIDVPEYQRGYEVARKSANFPKEYMEAQVLNAKATNNQSFLKGMKDASIIEPPIKKK